jgi:transaldolase
MAGSPTPGRSPIARLLDYGQSPWYDNLTRRLVESGGLRRLMDEDGIRGLTSNPTIFEKAMASGEGYDDQLAELGRAGMETDAIYWELVIHDVAAAADTLRPVYDETRGGDGFVSVEVAPDRAHEVEPTIEQALWLHGRLQRPNVMVKIPATAEGIPAVEEVLARGHNVNITLIFSLQRYDEVIEAYFRGLERLAGSGGDVSKIGSVASFFVSRVDTEADRRLPEGHALRGKVAVANAKLAYQQFRRRFSGPRWEALAAKGAQLQRPLWASTSTKNPAYSDTLYVDELIGPDTVNTLAQASIDAYRDHGDPQPDTIERDVEGAEQVMRDLAAAGVDYDDLTATLEREGVDSFGRSYLDCLATLGKRRQELLHPTTS